MTTTCASQPTQAFGTVGRMDAAVERTGMYSQRVPKACVGWLAHSLWYLNQAAAPALSACQLNSGQL